MPASRCIICSDLFDGVERLVTAPCGHVYHSKCLLKWLDSRETCPECGDKVLKKDIVELYFNMITINRDDPSCMRNEIDNLVTSLQEVKTKASKFTDQNIELRVKLARKEVAIHELEENHFDIHRKLNFRIQQAPNFRFTSNQQEIEIEELKNHTFRMKEVKGIITGTKEEADEILNQAFNNATSETNLIVAKRLAPYYSVMKRQLDRAIEEKNQFRSQANESNKNVGSTLSRMETTLRDLADGTWKEINRRIDNLHSAVRRTHLSECVTEFNDTFDPQPSTSSYSPCRNYKSSGIPEITHVEVGYEHSKKRKVDVLDQEREKVTCKRSASPLHFSPIESREKETDSVSNIDTMA